MQAGGHRPIVCLSCFVRCSKLLSTSPVAAASTHTRGSSRRRNERKSNDQKRQSQADKGGRKYSDLFNIRRVGSGFTGPEFPSLKSLRLQQSPQGALSSRRKDGGRGNSLGTGSEKSKRMKKKQSPEDMVAEILTDFRLRIHKDAILARLEIPAKALRDDYDGFAKEAKKYFKSRGTQENFMLDRLKTVVINEIAKGYYRSELIQVAVRAAFLNDLFRDKFDQEVLKNQAVLTSLKHPGEWWPGARHVQRTIHLHVGPTNSGKTYHALKRLESAEKGIYAGPLRLLAHEVYTRLNAAGRRCNLLTGDDRRFGDSEAQTTAPMTSCTVEMIPTSTDLDVAVIDEIQMIGHPERAWAWTQAVMGVRAKEVHLCGEARAVPIIQQLMAAVGEKVIVHEYERLSPLEMAKKSLDGDLSKLKKGDCIVAFNILTIHALRRTIEERTGRKCAIVYGSLPPETRVQQARLFNDPDNEYDYLVASNAVGMGLNLAIRRIIFQSSLRYDGREWITIDAAEIKQIGGRAGRYSNASEDIKSTVDVNDGKTDDQSTESSKEKKRKPGLVTTLEAMDFGNISKGMRDPLQPITKVGILPPDDALEHFAMYFPARTPTSYILIRFLEMARTSPLFFFCDMDQIVAAADVIEEVEGLSWTERMIFLAAPFSPRHKREWGLMQELATVVAEKRTTDVLELEHLDLDLLDDSHEMSREYLRSLEALHKGVVTFMWLSYRFLQNFLHPDLTRHVKELVEARIAEVIEKTAFAYNRDLANKRREQAMRDLLVSGEDSEDKSAEQVMESTEATDATHEHAVFDEPEGFDDVERHVQRDAGVEGDAFSTVMPDTANSDEGPHARP